MFFSIFFIPLGAMYDNTSNYFIEMKTTVRYAAALLMVALVTLLTSCKKDPETLQLAGTTWQASLTGGVFDGFTQDGAAAQEGGVKLVFNSDAAGVLTIGTGNAGVKFSYVVSGYNVKLTFAPEISTFFKIKDTTLDASYNDTFKTLTLNVGSLPLIFKKVS